MISFDHRPSSLSNDYTYDGLNRLEDVEYLDNVNDTESFTMDDLGNRTNVNLRSGSDETYAVNDETNRYDADGTFDVTQGYDNAGNMTSDHRGYDYDYDYENRLMRITKNSGATLVAEFEYDALGRRIKQNGWRYYYNDKWQQLLAVKNESSDDSEWKTFVYGNYIDEVLRRDRWFVWSGQVIYSGPPVMYYAHNHLFSTVALLDAGGDVFERYEYNAYGKATIWDAAFSYTRTTSNYGNPYTFTGRELDTLDSGDLSIMYYRNRYYDPETGRFLQHDPLGYVDGLSLYGYVKSSPLIYFDPFGNAIDPWSRVVCACAAKGMATEEIIKWLIFLGAAEEAARYAINNSSCDITITVPTFGLPKKITAI